VQEHLGQTADVETVRHRCHRAVSYSSPSDHQVCIDNLERSGNLTAIRDLTKSQGNVLKGKKSCREKWPKTVYCKLHICIHTDI